MTWISYFNYLDPCSRDSASVSLQTFITWPCGAGRSDRRWTNRSEWIKKNFFYGGGGQPGSTTARRYDTEIDPRNSTIIGRSLWNISRGRLIGHWTTTGPVVIVSCWPRQRDRDHRSCRRRRCMWYTEWTGVAPADNNVCVCAKTQKKRTETNTYDTMNVDRKRSRWRHPSRCLYTGDSEHCFNFITGRLLVFSPLTSAPFKPGGKYWENRYNKSMFSTTYLSGVLPFSCVLVLRMDEYNKTYRNQDERFYNIINVL